MSDTRLQPRRTARFRHPPGLFQGGQTEALILVLLLALLLLSAGLVWHDLGGREVLGRDENVTIIHVDQPSVKAVLDTIDIRFTGESGNMQPLYFVLQHLLWPLVRHSAFMFRFLPSAFAILAVALTYKLGATLFGRAAGLIAALLVALLPLNIRYAQIARPYPLLAAFSLASAYFLFRALDTHRPLAWLAFVVVTIVNFYTHYNALFVLAAEGLVAGAAWLLSLAAVLQKRQQLRRLIAPALSFLAIASLCLPAALRLFGIPWLGSAGEGETAGTIVVELTKPFFRGFLFRIGLMSGWLQALVVVLAVLGLAAALYRRRWREALLAVLWISLPFVILSIVKSPRPFEDRYVIFVPPMLFLLGGQGIVAVSQALAGRGRESAREMAFAVLALACTLGLVALFIQPLRISYDYSQSADRLEEVLSIVEKHAGPGETVLVSPRFLVRPLSVAGGTVVYLDHHPSPAEIDRWARESKRLWILCTSYLPPAELQEPLDQWLQAHLDGFVRVPIKTVNALSFGRLAPADPEASLLSDIAVLEDLARQSVGDYEAGQRHEALAGACQALGDLYQARGQPALAAEYWDRAEAARQATPSP